MARTSKVLYCRDVASSFNRRAAELREKALADGLTIGAEWSADGLNLFSAVQSQDRLKHNPGVFAEVGACISLFPRIWYTKPGSGKIYETVFHPKTVA